MSWEGLVIGAVSFLVIGLFHPIVIRAEYRWTKRIWPAFLAAGLVLLGVSLALPGPIPSAIAGVTGFSCLWSIRELYEQEERVRKGWFPRDPDRDPDRDA